MLLASTTKLLRNKDGAIKRKGLTNKRASR